MQPAELQSKQVTVVGAARSGRAAARLLAGAGATVFVTERGPGRAEVADALAASGIAAEFGGHTDQALAADFLVISPGVPTASPLVQQALGTGLPVYSEIEVASWFCRGDILAITGSNGKTTTTSLLGHLFQTADRPAVVAGNIGYSFSDAVQSMEPDAVAILEVSSFQLDHIDRFRPRVSILLNITPDHLDRYRDFDHYAQSKYRIFENQTSEDAVIYNHDDAPVRDHVLQQAQLQGFQPLGFSQTVTLDQGGFVCDDALVLRLNQQEEVLMQSEQLALRGRHNLYNSLAAAVAARVMEVRSEAIRKSLVAFEGVPHRLELVRTMDGVRYINDSKATNVNAVWYALESFDQPIVLIAGGRDKGNDYGMLKPLVRHKCRGVIAIGESGEKVLRELGPQATETARAFTMQEALMEARAMARRGDVVLLSPACASFDMFDNYEHRGDVFRDLVQTL